MQSSLAALSPLPEIFFFPLTSHSRNFLPLTSHWPDYRLPLSLNKRNETLKSDLSSVSHTWTSFTIPWRDWENTKYWTWLSEFLNSVGLGWDPRFCMFKFPDDAAEQGFETHRHRAIQIYTLWHWGEVQLPWRAWMSGGEWNIWVSVSQKITSCLVTQKHLTQLTSYSSNLIFHLVSKSWLKVNLNLEIEFCLNVDLPPFKGLPLIFNSLQ